MTEGVHNTQFIANPTQRDFIESRAEADLWACRMGEGKSAGLCWACWFHTRHNPGARWVFIRDTWVNLYNTTQKEFFSWFPVGVYGSYSADKKTFTWTAEGLRGEVMFMGMDDPGDASKLQSLSLAGAAMDEPAAHDAESGGISQDIFDALLTRLRQPGMKWYAVKLAENAPDEGHWSYKRFVKPGDAGTPPEEKILPDQARGFIYHRSARPENAVNLPPGYYATMRHRLRHRPDLVRRYAEGGFGYQQRGKAVTPEWSDDLHLADDLQPIRGRILHLSWDFGGNPTCTATQITPMGHWNILECWEDEDEKMGVEELIETVVRPRLAERYQNIEWQHTGDPTGMSPEQSSSKQTAVKVIKRDLGGRWYPGPIRIPDRVDPLRAVLRQTRTGVGVVQVDRELAHSIWMALRGGWHRHVSRNGQISDKPEKDRWSHPGDTMGYGAARLFPLGRLRQKRGATVMPRHAYYGHGSTSPGRPSSPGPRGTGGGRPLEHRP